MESLEIWMWLVAGFVALAIIIPVFFNLINASIKNQEVNNALESLDRLSLQIKSACDSGFFSQTSLTLDFPISLGSIYTVKNINGNNSEICLNFTGDKNNPYCNEIMNCIVSSNKIYPETDSRAYYLYSKLFHKPISYDYTFNITKRDYYDTNGNVIPGSNITWKPYLSFDI